MEQSPKKPIQEHWLTRRRIYRLSRIGLLLVILGLATQLNRWSQEEHPRFFQFMKTPTGRLVANIFGAWRPAEERPPVIKPDFLMTRAEKKMRREIEVEVGKQIRDAHPFAEKSPYRIAYRDVKFRSELPHLNMFVVPPYFILTDAEQEDVEPTINELKSLQHEIREVFSPLFTRLPEKELVHVAYFKNRHWYESYQRRHARQMEQTSGYYNPSANLLVLSEQPPPADPALGMDQTLATARHEATHQFFFTHGIHSIHRIENEWLIEGLANYCETKPIGAIDEGQRQLFQAAANENQLIKISHLVNHRNERGLLAYRPTELAYAQSLLLVQFLMTDQNRPEFFKYMRHIRNPDHFREVRDANRFHLLAEFLGLRPSELEDRWGEYAAFL